jgi:F-type H+-transporting ATPase subunit b
MLPAFTHYAADTTSGIGALGLSGSSLLIQLVTFLLAYLVLRKYAFKPILRVLQERREVIESGVKLGEEMQKERAALEAKVAKELQEARGRADGIVAEAHDAAQAAIRAAEDKARQKADNILKDAAAQTKQDAARVRAQLEKEVVGLISDATEAIIDEKLDDKKDAALINKVLKEQRA